MPRVSPLSPKDLPQFRDVIEAIDKDHGYVPNSFLTMGRLPALLTATGNLAEALWYPDTVTQPIRRLVSFSYSFFSGAMYSSAHTACGAPELGLPVEKIRAIADFETSPIFTEPERTVLRLCRHAARMPSEVTDDDVKNLSAHFDEQAQITIIGLIAWHAFLNKWNDLMGSQLEEIPKTFAEKNLSAIGWTGWKHR